MAVEEREIVEKRLRSSGGRLRGWVSESYLLPRREEDDETPGSVDCLESLDWREVDFVSRDESCLEDFLGDLEEDEEDLVGEGGSE